MGAIGHSSLLARSALRAGVVGRASSVPIGDVSFEVRPVCPSCTRSVVAYVRERETTCVARGITRESHCASIRLNVNERYAAPLRMARPTARTRAAARTTHAIEIREILKLIYGLAQRLIRGLVHAVPALVETGKLGKAR